MFYGKNLTQNETHPAHKTALHPSDAFGNTYYSLIQWSMLQIICHGRTPDS